jgi:hypothetical protein
MVRCTMDAASGAMSLSSQIALTAARLFNERAQSYADRALRLVRRGAEHAALRMDSEAPRIAELTEAGLRATEVSYRGLDRLVRQGLDSARGALADGAERLRITARAESLGAFYAAQWAMLPKSRDRITRELGATWEIVRATGRELVEVARSARDGLGKGRARGARARTRRPRKSKQAVRRRGGLPRSS